LKIDVFAQSDDWPQILYASLTNHSSCRRTRVNVLSGGIIATIHSFDRRADGRTDRHFTRA